MIRSIIQRVFGRKRGSLRVYPYREHHIQRDALSPLALKICDRLHQQGYAAFVVGGAVRDLLLGQQPKDFDVATDATPEQVRNIFRRSRIIGRRFQIVHVFQGNDIVEVSTFRAGSNDAHTDASGRVLHDNVFGSQEEDALRRDFTANALYYNPRSEEIIDYHHGVPDIRAGRLVLIGEPERRFREDPVRMLRAVRLAGKVGLTIDPAARAAIMQCAEWLKQIPQARLLDEFIKVLECGASWPVFAELKAVGLLPMFMPVFDRLLAKPEASRFIELALTATDSRLAQGKSMSIGYVFAALLWPEVLFDWRRREGRGEKAWPALFSAIEAVLERSDQGLGIPRRHTAIMREIWTLQPRFEQRQGQRPYRLLENERYRAGYDFLLLRREVDASLAELADWWTAFACADSDERALLQQNLGRVATEAPKRRRRRKKPSNAKSSGTASE